LHVCVRVYVRVCVCVYVWCVCVCARVCYVTETMHLAQAPPQPAG